MVDQDLGESDVPLTEDVVKKPLREFSATFSEWAADNVEQIWITDRVTSGRVLYTVPENFTLFITSGFIAGHSTAVGGTHGDLRLQFGTASKLFIIVACTVDHHTTAVGTASSMALSFPMPLKINQGEIVEIAITGVSNPFVVAGFTGFLLPKKISIR